MRVIRRKCLGAGSGYGEVEWERVRLFPVPGIGGADEQERRAASALLAVVQSVREFGRAITVPIGAPAGRLSAYIEVPFTDGDKKLRPDLIESDQPRRIYRRSSHRLTSSGIGLALPSIESEVKHIGGSD
jgi:hypothetical protein